MRAFTIAAVVGAGIATIAASASDARSLRNGAPTTCSVFDSHPCTPTSCSVFDRNPCFPEVQYPIGQDLRLTIESARSSQYKMPEHELNTISDLFASLRACWQPPLDVASAGTQISIRFSFNASGNLIAPPRQTYVTKDTPAEARQVYRDSIATALYRCAPLHFTKGLAGAIAGRPIAVRYVENRSQEGLSTP